MSSLLQMLGGARRAALAPEVQLHLISAHALLQARAEAVQLAPADADEAGLVLNACILARAARKDGKPLFDSGEAVLRAMPAEKIGFWMEKYLALCAQENPSCCTGTHEEVKDALVEDGYERLKWRVLRAFGVLPSEARAREMTDGDYLYCVLQMTLDEEERLEQLCPSCRAEAESRRCAVCGAALGERNASFDEARFEELRRGGLCADAASGTGRDGGADGRQDGACAAGADAQPEADAGADAT